VVPETVENKIDDEATDDDDGLSHADSSDKKGYKDTLHVSWDNDEDVVTEDSINGTNVENDINGTESATYCVDNDSNDSISEAREESVAPENIVRLDIDPDNIIPPRQTKRGLRSALTRTPKFDYKSAYNALVQSRIVKPYDAFGQ